MKSTPNNSNQAFAIALLLTLSCVTTRASEEASPEACAGYDLLHVANGDLSSAPSIFMHSTLNPDRSDAKCAAAIIKNSSHNGNASVHMSYDVANLFMREFLNALSFQFTLTCIGNLKNMQIMKKSDAHCGDASIPDHLEYCKPAVKNPMPPHRGPKIYLGNRGVSTAAFLRKKPQQLPYSADHRNYTKGRKNFSR